MRSSRNRSSRPWRNGLPGSSSARTASPRGASSSAMPMLKELSTSRASTFSRGASVERIRLGRISSTMIPRRNAALAAGRIHLREAVRSSHPRYGSQAVRRMTQTRIASSHVSRRHCRRNSPSPEMKGPVLEEKGEDLLHGGRGPPPPADEIQDGFRLLQPSLLRGPHRPTHFDFWQEANLK